MKYIILFFILSLTAYSAERIYKKNNLYWIDYKLKLGLSESINLDGNFQSRRFLPDRPNQNLGTLTISKTFKNNWTIGQGFTYFRLYLPQEINTDIELVPQEFRPFQYASLKNEITDGLFFKNRILIEERFFQRIEDDNLIDKYNFIFRIRLKGSLDYSFIKINSEKNNFGAFIANEVLIQFGNNIIFNTFDQNRFQAGVFYEMNKNLKLSLSYLHWLQETSEFTNEGFYYLSRHTAVITISNSFDLF